MTNRHSVVVVMAVCAVISACVATPGRISQTKPVALLDAPKGLAVEGYDVVSYFESSEPRRGAQEFVYRYRGADWHFASAAHRDLFSTNPERYEPQYGNYCAFAVSRGGVAHGDPQLWAIVGGKLYLNNNRFAMDLWDEDRPGNIAAGDQNWPLLPKLPPR